MDLYFTDRQLDVMNILWDRGSATVREAKEELDEDLAYTSVLTVFQTLEEHGHVDHEREGKAYLTIALGCTGGRHRSVALAEELARRLRVGRDVRVAHRDAGRGGT